MFSMALLPLSIVTSLTYTILGQSFREEVMHTLRAIANGLSGRFSC